MLKKNKFERLWGELESKKLRRDNDLKISETNSSSRVKDSIIISRK